jgi:hypothetical protein
MLQNGLTLHFYQVTFLENIVLVTLQRGEVTYTVIYRNAGRKGNTCKKNHQPYCLAPTEALFPFRKMQVFFFFSYFVGSCLAYSVWTGLETVSHLPLQI